MNKQSLGHKIIKGLLNGGLILFAASTPGGKHKLLRALDHELKKRQERQRFLWTVRYLRHKKIINYEENRDGTIKIVLTEAGKKIALSFNFDDITLKKTKPGTVGGEWLPLTYQNINAKGEMLCEINLKNWECCNYKKVFGSGPMTVKMKLTLSLKFLA